MPTAEVPKRFKQEEEHRYKLAEVSGLLLHGAHNEVHDLEFLLACDYTRFPNGGALLGTAITGITNPTGTICEAATSTAHGLEVGDIACIASAAVRTEYVGSWTITAKTATTFRFDLGVAWTATDTGWLYQGLTNDRITPDTVGLIVPSDANGAARYAHATGIYQVAGIGYMEFFHLAGAVSNFKLVLFGD